MLDRGTSENLLISTRDGYARTMDRIWRNTHALEDIGMPFDNYYSRSKLS